MAEVEEVAVAVKMVFIVIYMVLFMAKLQQELPQQS